MELLWHHEPTYINYLSKYLHTKEFPEYIGYILGYVLI